MISFILITIIAVALAILQTVTAYLLKKANKRINVLTKRLEGRDSGMRGLSERNTALAKKLNECHQNAGATNEEAEKENVRLREELEDTRKLLHKQDKKFRDYNSRGGEM